MQATAGYFVGSITIGTDTSVGSAATGVWLANPVGGPQFLMKKSGTTKVNFDTATDTYYVAGELYATKFTVIANAANSVDFGADVKINGDLYLSSTAASHTYYYESPTCYSYWNTAGRYLMSKVQYNTGYFSWTAGLTTAGNDDAQLVVKGNTTASGGGQITLTGTTSERDIIIECGTTATSTLELRRGITTVMSFAGNSSTVTFSGIALAANVISQGIAYIGASGSAVSSGTADPTGGSNGDIYMCSGTNNGLWHKKAGTWTRL